MRPQLAVNLSGEESNMCACVAHVLERPTGGEEGTREVAGIRVFLELKGWRGVRRPQGNPRASSLTR